MLAALDRSNPTSSPVCRCEVPLTAYAACQHRDALTIPDRRPQPRSQPIAQGSRAHWCKAVEPKGSFSSSGLLLGLPESGSRLTDLPWARQGRWTALAAESAVTLAFSLAPDEVKLRAASPDRKQIVERARRHRKRHQPEIAARY